MGDKSERTKGGGSGAHGIDYQLDIIMLYFLKAYNTGTDFTISSEMSQYEKFDDVALQAEGHDSLVQAKHIENKKEKISLKDLLGDNKKFGLLNYLKSFEIICLNILKEVANRMEKLEPASLELVWIRECLHKVNIKSEIRPEDLFNKIITKVEKMQDTSLQKKLNWLKNVNFFLITNIDVDSKVTAGVASRSEFLEEHLLRTNGHEFYYKFNVEKMPEEFHNHLSHYFFDKFKLVILKDSVLRQNVETAVNELNKSNQSRWDCNLLRTHIKQKINDWYISGKKEVLNTFNLECILSELQSNCFIDELSKFKDEFDFQFDELLTTINERSIILIKTVKYLLLIIKLQQKTRNKGILIVNPDEGIESQIRVTKSFKHPKYSYYICIISRDNFDKLVPIINTVVKECKHKNYKKFILFSEADFDFQCIPDITLITDEGYYENFILKDLGRLKSLGELENYYVKRRLEREDHNFSEEEISKIITSCNERFVVIIDGPGMGKTTLLKSLTCQVNNREPRLWAIYINLNDHTNLLKQGLKCNRLELKDFLETISNNKIQDILKKQIATLYNNIILFVDSVDEVSPKYLDIVFKFLHNTSSKVAKVVVSSREHLRTQLSESLNVKPFSLQIFDYDDQKKVILSFWFWKLEYQDKGSVQKYKRYCKMLLDYFAKSSTHWNILGIPLQTKMVAEIFLKHVKSEISASNNNNNDHFVIPHSYSLVELYDDFIKTNKEIYFEEKCRTGGNGIAEEILENQFNNYLKICQQLAVRTVFKRKQYMYYKIPEVIHENLYDNQLYQIGLITLPKNNWWLQNGSSRNDNLDYEDPSSEDCINEDLNNNYSYSKNVNNDDFDKRYSSSKHFNDQKNLKSRKFYIRFNDMDKLFNHTIKHEYTNMPQFIHQTFAEYFVAQKTIEKLLNVDTESRLAFYRFVLIDIFSNPSLFVIQMFINDYLKSHWNSITNLTLNMFCEILRQIRITSDRNFNHLASHNYFYILKLLLEGSQKSEWINNNFKGSCSNIVHLSSTNLDTLKLLLEHGADINIKGENSETILHYVADRGCLEATEFIVERIKYLDEVDVRGETALRRAIIRHRLKVFRFLVDNGASLSQRDIFGWTDLHSAAATGNENIVRIVLEKGVNIDERVNGHRSYDSDYDNPFSGYTALRIAFSKLHFGLCQYLFENGSNINATDDLRRGLWYVTALRNAFLLEISVKFLINNNVAIDSEAPSAAAQKDNYLLLQYFIIAGIDVNSKNQSGFNPLQESIRNKSITSCKLLLAHNADVTVTTPDNLTVLHLAAKTGSLELFRTLEDKYPHINTKTPDGVSTLHLAAATGSVELVNYICDKCDREIPYSSTSNLCNILHYAAYGTLNVVKLLFERFAVELTTMDIEGDTVLHKAVAYGKLDMLSYLMDSLTNKGIDLNFKLKDGSYKLYTPDEIYYKEITDILLAAGIKKEAIAKSNSQLDDIGYYLNV